MVIRLRLVTFKVHEPVLRPCTEFVKVILENVVVLRGVQLTEKDRIICKQASVGRDMI